LRRVFSTPPNDRGQRKLPPNAFFSFKHGYPPPDRWRNSRLATTIDSDIRDAFDAAGMDTSNVIVGVTLSASF